MTAHRPSAGSIQRWPARPWFLALHVAAVSSDLGNRPASDPPARLLFRGEGVEIRERHGRSDDDLTPDGQTKNWGRCHDGSGSGAKTSGIKR